MLHRPLWSNTQRPKDSLNIHITGKTAFSMLVLRNRVSNMECHDFHEKKKKKKKNENNNNKNPFAMQSDSEACNEATRKRNDMGPAISSHRTVHRTVAAFNVREGYQTCGIGRDSKNKNIYIKIKI